MSSKHSIRDHFKMRLSLWEIPNLHTKFHSTRVAIAKGSEKFLINYIAESRFACYISSECIWFICLSWCPHRMISFYKTFGSNSKARTLKFKRDFTWQTLLAVAMSKRIWWSNNLNAVDRAPWLDQTFGPKDQNRPESWPFDCRFPSTTVCQDRLREAY